MNNLFEKSIDLGLGLFVYSRERIEEMVEELVDKGEIAKKDARKFAGELIKRGEDQRNELKTLIKDEITSALNDINIAKKEDLVSKMEIREIIREELIKVLNEQGLSEKENAK